MTPLSSQEKGRYKKLSKRARLTAQQQQQGTSHHPWLGIASLADWKELQCLHERHQQSNSNTSSPILHQQLPGTCIGWRKSPPPTLTQGVDHRAILHSLLMSPDEIYSGDDNNSNNSNDNKIPSHNQKTANHTKTKRAKKKKPSSSSSSSSSLPSWVSLSNPYAVNHVGVIEVHCPTPQQMTQLIQLLEMFLSEEITPNIESSQYSLLSTPTMWFGSYSEPGTSSSTQTRTHNNDTESPQCISQALMYRKCFPTKMDDSFVAPQSPTELAHAWQQLTLSPNQLQQEQYPLQGGYDSKKAKHTKEEEPPKLNHDESWKRYANHTPIDIAANQALEWVNQWSLGPIHWPESSSTIHSDNNDDDDDRNWIASIPLNNNNNNKEDLCRIFGMDCEMVRTRVGFELARVTLLELPHPMRNEEDLTLTIVWDVIVQPKHPPVLDYLTQYSGITATLLESSPPCILEQVQVALRATIGASDILVGHSLENDLRAVRFVHTTVVDTAVLFRSSSSKRFKYSLRTLAWRLLHKSIQNPQTSHDSYEDAATALELAHQKVWQGPSFVLHDARRINLLHALSSSSTNRKQAKHTIVAVGPNKWIQTHITNQPNAIHALAVTATNNNSSSLHHSNYKAVSSWLYGPSVERRAKLVWAYCTVSMKDNDQAAKKNSTTSPSVERLKQYLKEWIAALNSQTVLGIMVQGGYAKAHDCHEQRVSHWKKKRKATLLGWNDDDDAERQWKAAIQECRPGHVFWIGFSGTNQTKQET